MNIPYKEKIQLQESLLPESNPDSGIHSFVYFIHFIDAQSLSIIGLSSWEWMSIYADFFDLLGYKQNIMDIQNYQIEYQTEVLRGYDLHIGELSLNGYKVYINQQEINLEIPDSSMTLERPVLSPNRQWIGGTLKIATNYELLYGTGQIRWYKISLWNSETGELIFVGEPELQPSLQPVDLGTQSLQVKFSPDSDFLIIRGLRSTHGLGLEDPLLLVDMINTYTFKFLYADKDVAFTSDSRFFVTEREGKPALVDAQWDHVWQWYDTGEDIMTAATFSPDDERLYIATSANNIYVFESRLPAACVKDWEVYP